MLPVGAALAVLLTIFALAAAPGWFNRDGFGYEEPTLDASLLGILTLLLVPVQILLVVFAMRGFKQGWNVELERRDPSAAGGHLVEFARAPCLRHSRLSSRCLATLRRWRNGRRGALKRPCPKGRVGSSPTRRTL